MFFIMGITDGQKRFDFTQVMICGLCGKYGRCEVFMTYTCLSLFFIPCFRWNRRYYVRMTCCNGRMQRRCANWGFSACEDFEYCPHCGQRMMW